MYFVLLYTSKLGAFTQPTTHIAFRVDAEMPLTLFSYVPAHAVMYTMMINIYASLLKHMRPQ